MTARDDRLGISAARSVVWTLAATISARAVSLAGLALLARLLAPADFGLFAFALLYITYAETASDLGTGMALIYWPTRQADAAQVTFGVGLAMAGLWFGLTFALAPLISDFFHNPAGEPLLRALAWTFPIKALGLTHDALCQKDLRFRVRLLPELGMAGVKAFVSIVLALSGFGVWSLVWGHLAGLSLWTMILWMVSPWRPAPGMPWDLMAPMLQYGRGIIAVNVIAAVVHHADLVVVGRLLGTTALGFYQMAYKVPELAIMLLMRAVSTVIFPTFSKIGSEGDALNRAYLATLRYTAVVVLPAGAVLFALADAIVVALFGETWRPAVPILRALAAYCSLRALGSSVGDVLKATGRPNLLAGLGLVKAALLLPALILAARMGTTQVATAMALITMLALLLNLGVICHLQHISVRSVIGAIRLGVIVALIVAGALVLAQAATDFHTTGRLFFGLALSASVYVVLLRSLSPELWRQLTSMMARSGAEPAGSAALSLPELP